MISAMQLNLAGAGIKGALFAHKFDLPIGSFIAGGFVRDIILGRSTGDLDLYYHKKINVPDLVDLKITDNSLEGVLRTFQMSLCQCGYSQDLGVVVSHDFAKTLVTRHVTIDPNISNWNEWQDGRDKDHHYKKMVRRFPDFTFDALPEKMSAKHPDWIHTTGS